MAATQNTLLMNPPLLPLDVVALCPGASLCRQDSRPNGGGLKQLETKIR